MKKPGKCAGSGSISRLGPRSIDRPLASKILIGNHEKRICDPQLLLRLKTNSIVCFLRLAGHFNRTHVAINKYCSANKNQRPRWGSRATRQAGRPYAEKTTATPTAKVKIAGWQPALRIAKRKTTSPDTHRTKFSRQNGEKNAQKHPQYLFRLEKNLLFVLCNLRKF
jgi:hypothetical protein